MLILYYERVIKKYDNKRITWPHCDSWTFNECKELLLMTGPLMICRTSMNKIARHLSTLLELEYVCICTNF